MKRFSFKFIGSMLISGFITGVILNILFQFTFEGIRIDPENKQLPLMLRRRRAGGEGGRA